MFVKGRGYTAYGSFESKVSLGLNTAKGKNEGVVNISFDALDYHKKLVKFTFPTGEVSGLTIGDRTLTLVGNTYFLDEENRIFAEVIFSKHKGIT